MANKDYGLIEVMQAVRERIEERTGFSLPNAVCPFSSRANLQIGFRYDFFIDENSGFPGLAISQTKELLLDLFVDIITFLFDAEADIVLRGKCDEEGQYKSFKTESVDLRIFISALSDFENLILNNGLMEIRILSPDQYFELWLDDDKLIIFRSPAEADIIKLANLLESQGIREKPKMETVRNTKHIHESSKSLEQRFEQFVRAIGAIENE